MKKAAQSSNQKDKWVPAIGETIYTAGSSKVAIRVKPNLGTRVFNTLL